MRPTPNLFADLPAAVPDEICQTLLTSPHIRIERIISRGQASPEGFWYDQEMHEWVLILQGAARVRFEGGETVEMRLGAFINIPAHQRHRVDWTDPERTTIWLAVHYRS